MYFVERLSKTLRHSWLLGRIDGLWDFIRPFYDRTLVSLYRKGLERNINGTDRILIHHKTRQAPEIYEPDVWAHLMSNVRPDDTTVDVGAYIGLYAIALSKRTGPSGRVFAFEPDHENFELLKENVKLNDISDKMALIEAAVGESDGYIYLKHGRHSESHICQVPDTDSVKVRCICLDSAFAQESIDILKIDVEGYEESVLRGGLRLLSDPERSPRLIYVEVHPYAWQKVGTTSNSLLGFLKKCGYMVSFMNGKMVRMINRYGEIVAKKS